MYDSISSSRKLDPSAGDQAPLLSVDQLSVAYEALPALWDLSFSLPKEQMTAIVGPNGAGKSTLLSALVGQIRPLKGEVLFWGQEFSAVRRRIAFVPQTRSVDWNFPITVEQLVMMGRYGHLGWFRWPTSKDRAIVTQALEDVGMASFAKRHISQLSGGQRQRIFFARALAQQVPLLLLDEPFSAVDLATERQLVELLRSLVAKGCTALVVHHDLHTVKSYFDYMLLLNVRLVACGPVDEVFHEKNIDLAYGRPVSLLERVTKASAR